MKRRSLLSLLPAASALVALRSEGRPVPAALQSHLA